MTMLQEMREAFAAYMKGEKPDPGLYVGRPFVMSDEFAAWAEENDIELDDKLHTTVLYSKVSIPWQNKQDTVTARVTGMKLLGKDNAVVLVLDCPATERRYKQALRAGAVSDYDSYTPHMTLFYLGAGYDSTQFRDGELPPLPDFPLQFGPEKSASLDEDALEKININHVPAGSRRGGQFAPKAGTGYTADKEGVWRLADGTPATREHEARLKEIKASGGYKDIRINPDPDHYLQAVGSDAKGRRKAFYKPGFDDIGKEVKYSRNEAFHKARPRLIAAIDSDLARTDLPKAERDAAVILKLIDLTAFRPGSDKNTKAEKKAFGATTLQARHVKINGDTISFSFTGKKGVSIKKTLVNAQMARELAPRVKKGGALFEADAPALRRYMKDKGFGDFMPKDFRTWNGTAKALEVMKGMPVPKNATQLKAAQKKVSEAVAAHLGNTPIMAFNSYINPKVWAHWELAA